MYRVSDGNRRNAGVIHWVRHPAKVHTSRSRRLLLSYALLATVLLLCLKYIFESATSSSQNFTKHHPGAPSGDLDPLLNGTLGFSRIFVVGLPERSDKRDAMTLTSALTGFRVEFSSGVRGETIVDKAVPFPQDRNLIGENALGSWRGHMDVIRRIVEEDIQSALIMEDDVDWDVRLKSQLAPVAQGARYLFPNLTELSSPYGSDWDILWLGHCGEIFPEVLPENEGKPEHPKYVMEDDETVPPFDHITGLVDFQKYREHTRWVHVSGGPICTFAYAVSQRGARKVLFDLSVDHLTGNYDNALAWLCRDGASRNPDGLRAKCVSVTPPIFHHHRPKGLITGDSDIQVVQDTSVREKGTTENIRWSARNNIQNLLMGREMESQF
ncbi:hypothetical protein F4778DRAFT_61133 [Xylariomycetidae sp. FL2044]|nr:hypothetical protein F4778DRAFT_61133 [Xylariomycetidae sp. FL2044]